MPGGRPTRLTATLTAEITQAVKTTGCKPHHAAILAGVPLGTFQGWQKVAKRAEGKPARHLTQMERRCLQLSRDLARAEATYSLALEAIIAGYDQSGRPLDDPALIVRTAMWWLERRVPEEYGRHRGREMASAAPAASPVTGDLATAFEKLKRLHEARTMRGSSKGSPDEAVP